MANNPIFAKGTLSGVTLQENYGAEPQHQTAWVIEGKDGMFIGAHFACYGRNGKRESSFVWRSGHENAIRFARREDAEVVLGICETLGIQFDIEAPGVNEHMWG